MSTIGRPALLEWIENKDSPFFSTSPESEARVEDCIGKTSQTTKTVDVFKETVILKTPSARQKNSPKKMPTTSGDKTPVPVLPEQTTPLPPAPTLAPLTSLSNLPPISMTSKPLARSSSPDPLLSSRHVNPIAKSSPPLKQDTKPRADLNEDGFFTQNPDLEEFYYKLKNTEVADQNSEEYTEYTQDDESAINESIIDSANQTIDVETSPLEDAELATTDRSASPTFLTGLALHDFVEPVELLEL